MRRLGALATDAAGELDVLGHDGDTLGVDGAKAGVFEETNEVRDQRGKPRRLPGGRERRSPGSEGRS